jgi:hypothetical protein
MLMAIGEEVLAVITVAILAIVAIAVMRRPRKREKKQTAAPVRSVSDAVCEAWRIIDQVYDFVKEARAMTAKELDDLKDLFHVFKGHVEALERMTARPDAVEELRSFRDYVELLLPHLERGGLPGDALSKITSMRDRFNKLRGELGKKLACNC